MKTIIAGSRTINNYLFVQDAVSESGFHITEVVCGLAKGADLLGRSWANNNDVPVICFPADWDKHGKAAGYIRNKEMAAYAEACIVIWDGQSRGSKHMIDLAKQYNLKLFVKNV